MIFTKKEWTLFLPWSENSAITSLFSSMENIFQLEGEIISKSAQSEIFSQQLGGKTYFIKRYFKTDGIRSWLGFSRLRVEARNQQWFHKVGILAGAIV